MPASKIFIDTTKLKFKKLLKALLQSSLNAADPNKALKKTVTRKNHHLWVNHVKYDLSHYHRIVCVGAGKASGHMARTLEHLIDECEHASRAPRCPIIASIESPPDAAPARRRRAAT